MTGQASTVDPGTDGDHARVLVIPLQVVLACPSGPTSRTVSSAEVVLRVLVSADGGGPDECAALVTDLALNALESGLWRLNSEPPDLLVWRGLGLTPRPALLIDLPARRLLDRRPAPPVRRPLRVESLPLRDVSGRVVAADGTPVPAAALSVIPSGPHVVTDRRGRFVLKVAVPDTGLRAQVQARNVTARLDLTPEPDGALGDLILNELGDQTEPTPATPQEV